MIYLIFTYLFKWSMFVKQSIHVHKKIVKRMINIFLHIKNSIRVQYKLFFIKIWPTSLIDIGFAWMKKGLKKLMAWEKSRGRWSDIVNVKFQQIAFLRYMIRKYIINKSLGVTSHSSWVQDRHMVKSYWRRESLSKFKSKFESLVLFLFMLCTIIYSHIYH